MSTSPERTMDTTALPVSQRVLLVDGHTDSRDMYEQTLREAGYLVETASDAVEAIERLARRLPRVVVLELALSGALSGWDLSRCIRAHDRTSRLPIIAVTSRVYPSDLTRALDAGCDAVLAKPCPPHTLLAEVHRILLRASLHRSQGVVRAGRPGAVM